jgi:hypothetical protein
MAAGNCTPLCSSSDIINGFGLENDNQYNEFQSDSSASDNTANAKNTNLKTIMASFLSKKLGQWVGFNAVGNKNSLSFGVDIGFKFSKLPWTVNECVRTQIINNKLAALNLSGYNAKMIMNRAEAMSCGGCHQNSNGAEIAPNVKWPPSKFFVHPQIL